MKKTKKTAVKKHRNWLIALLFLAGLIIILSLGNRGFIRQIKLERETDKLRREILAEKQEIDRLEKEKEKLNTPEYKEKIAREEYGMAKKNEKVFLVVPEKEK